MKRAIIFAVAALAACHQSESRDAQAAGASRPNALKVSSTVDHMRIVAATKLPANPKPVRVEEYCSAYAVAKPKSSGGRLAARFGWIVTSETKLGKYDAVTFVGALEGSTSATCFHVNGNLAIFDGSHVRAIADWQRSSEYPLTKGDDGVEDSLGSADQIDKRRIRLYHGLPSGPFADVVLRDEISIEEMAKEDAVCGGAAKIPNIYNEDIRRARKKLHSFGWLPVKPAPEEGMSGGEELVQQGVIEVEACSGTGYGFCAFNYEHKEAMDLRVISAGEDYHVIGYEAHCGGTEQDRSAG